MSLEQLARVLREHGPGMDVLQAVRLVERLRPDRDRVGEASEPSAEAVRFSVHPSFAFPPGDVHAVDLADEGPVGLEVNTFGLVGPDGMLPHVYTDAVARRRREGDWVLGDFLDIFQHRMLGLLVRALRKVEPAAARERAGPEGDRLFRHLLDSFGLWYEAAKAERLEPLQLARFAALIGPQRRSAIGLELLVEGRFGVPVEVEPFVGSWIRLSPDDLCELGSDAPSTRLGRGAVVGDEIWDPQARVRVRIGPLDRETFDRFLPGGEHHEKLRALCRFFVHDQFVVEACLVLERDDVPECVVSDEEGGPALGWSTWIRTRPLDRDPDETLLTL